MLRAARCRCGRKVVGKQNIAGYRACERVVPVFFLFFASGAHIVVMEDGDRLAECRLGADDHLAPSIVST
jgi:hypothetical protein